MRDEYEATVAGVAQTWNAWAALGDDLDTDGWATPTRCPGWDVAALFAHVSMFPRAFAEAAPGEANTGEANTGEANTGEANTGEANTGRAKTGEAKTGEAKTGEVLTAVDILRRFNEPGGVAYAMAGMNADWAVSEAVSCAPADLVARFAVTGRQAVERLRAAGPATVVPWPAAGPTTLAEGLRIVLMESVVHLLDAFRALGRPLEVPGPALRETALLLAEMAPPVEFIEAATGRSDRSPLPVLR
ncbi:maleylpyruvate isomerase N-terminal domain-containing protein [Actinoplanes sp. NPDC049681]|uniref:maleylpyruvate isomerase N-terminal domain-containing protein n=1 Tax=Actinoplanes sp. NPDC049681 TaxID=3363905 RepID=UPI003790B69E